MVYCTKLCKFFEELFDKYFDNLTKWFWRNFWRTCLSYIDTVRRKSCVSPFCEVEILNPTNGKTCTSSSVRCCGVTRIISFYNFGIPVKCQVWLLYFCASFRDGFHCFRSTQFYTNSDAFVRTLLIKGTLNMYLLMYLDSTICS